MKWPGTSTIAQTQTYQVEFQSFNADNSTASPVTQLVSQTGVAGYANAEGWFFRSANGTSAPMRC